MTVAELIEILKGMPQDAPVTVPGLRDEQNEAREWWGFGPGDVAVADSHYFTFSENPEDHDDLGSPAWGPQVRLGW